MPRRAVPRASGPLAELREAFRGTEQTTSGYDPEAVCVHCLAMLQGEYKCGTSASGASARWAQPGDPASTTCVRGGAASRPLLLAERVLPKRAQAGAGDLCCAPSCAPSCPAYCPHEVSNMLPNAYRQHPNHADKQ